VVIGYNSKLDALQARILSWKLGHVEQWNAQRAAVASSYREQLRNLPLTFQSTDSLEQHAYHLFQIRTRSRDALMAYLRARGVDATVRYPVPIHLQPAFSRYGWRKGQFPVAERLAEELLCLPIRPDMSSAEVEQVVGLIRAFFGT
jgi:dTDP-4-amino-4,6-dideoxygalactose transaminase